MKKLIKKIPGLYPLAKAVYFTCVAPFKPFAGSEEYWKLRYKAGGTSGVGSYNKFAEFKAEVLNGFVRDNRVETIIEYGCGDGNQLKLSEYPSYIGFDVSQEAIAQCENIFSHDGSKSFKLVELYAHETAQLTLSLDTIYHLVEDAVFFAYMKRLFDSSTRFVIIYSSDTERQARLQAAHVRHRKFSTWIEQYKPEWHLIRHIPNRYPYTNNEEKGSFADFYIYGKA